MVGTGGSQGRHSTDIEIREPRQQPDNNGFRCVWSNDINKYANQVYTARFGEANHHTGDIKGVDAEEIPDHDLLCAGFPCQAFSVAGKRKGFKDTRGTLFFEIQRVAEAKRPRLLLLENVKGLLSHDGGRTFATILNALEELGYWWEYQVLNSKHFGVPQNRERVFIIGHLGEPGRGAVFPITEAGEMADRDIEGEGDGFEKPLPELKSNSGAQYNELLVQPVLMPEPSQKRHGVMVQVGNIFSSEASDGRVYSPEGISPTVRPSDYGWAKPKIVVQPLRFLNRNQRNFDETAMTVDTTNSTGIREGTRIRRLTPVECERLQGFPDGWTEGLSDTQRYRCLGNAVTVPVIKFLGDRIMESMNSKSKRIET